MRYLANDNPRPTAELTARWHRRTDREINRASRIPLQSNPVGRSSKFLINLFFPTIDHGMSTFRHYRHIQEACSVHW
jgi:hypothetical protein